jgi:serine/threonine-protein kinase RsbW
MEPKFQSDFEDMAHARALLPTPQGSRSFPFVELQQCLSSQVAIISPFVDQLMCFIARYCDLEESESEIELALREALVNAIIHGNQEDLQKRVYVTCRCTTDGEVSITVEDEGQGFEDTTVADPTTAENLQNSHGRGIYLMKAFMDEVRFEQGGAMVVLRKKCNPATSAKRKLQ